MKSIDLRSDTITLPTEEMRRAIYEAELGDDVFLEDPTVNRLEELATQILNKEAALFTCSGTMSNLIAIMVSTNHGDEIIVGSESHIFWYEVGGSSALGGVVMRTVKNDSNGQMNPEEVVEAIRGENIHFPPTTLLCLENTHNRCDGAVLSTEYLSLMQGIAHKHGIGVHMDGSRIFNAAISLGIPASQLAATADSISFCLGKGLSAPGGSLLCGTKEFIEEARKCRKMLGGGMRQVGVLAAAGIVALNTMIDRLSDDHEVAKKLAHGLANIPGIIIEPDDVHTNIVMFQPPNSISAVEFVQQMENHGVRFLHYGGQKVRAVTHRMIDSTDIEEALQRISNNLKGGI